MPSHDILGNDALIAPAALARAIVPMFVFYTGRDRRFVQEMQDQSIKRGSSAKELGEARRSQLQQMAAMVKGFGCRPVVTYLRALRAGVRKPPRKEPAGAGRQCRP